MPWWDRGLLGVMAGLLAAAASRAWVRGDRTAGAVQWAVAVYAVWMCWRG